ncbi:hypothetical protein GQR58_011929 [Nymphon striatum]|nr:hypothetical protein GQR58_011929 [Nymphon striatum]
MASGKQSGGGPPGSVPNGYQFAPKYPSQPAIYPGAYPPAYQAVPGGISYTNASIPQGPPPPYMPSPQAHYAYPYQPTQVSQAYAQYYQQAHYSQLAAAAAAAAQMQAVGQNATVVVPEAYNAGARFDGIARPVIPPPPPGVAPNAAQIAAMQGNQVVLGQRQNDELGGGAGGGSVFW